MKNNITNALFISTLLLVNMLTYAQEKKLKNLDDLKEISYSYLENASTSKKLKKEVNFLHAKKWLTKSKAEENWLQAAKAYKTLMHLDEKSKLLKYSDSLVDTALKSKNTLLIGNAYLSKGIIYKESKEISKALDNYLIADQYISKTNDEYSINKLRYSMAHTKYYLGFYQEAITALKECSAYFQEENERGYLNSLHCLGLCYNKTGNFTLCTYYNELGLKESIELDNVDMTLYFKHSEAINNYYKKEYTTTIHNLKEIIPEMIEKRDKANETLAHFYMAKSYWALKQKEQAIPYLLKVDSMFKEQKHIHPVLRESYELLIKYYEDKNDLKSELTYINKLLEADKIINNNYKYLSQKIFKEYDTKKLKEEKLAIEKEMKTNSKLYCIVLITLAVSIIIMSIIHFQNKKNYKAKFDELMTKTTSKNKTVDSSTEKLDINPEIVEAVLKKLDKFEKTNKYLEKDMNLSKLATLLYTNSKYAGKIILKYKGKGTIEYITDLKIDYIVEKLKTENKFRNYTNKALGEEAGFRSTQNFTKAFKNRTEISPTYFIQKLKQQQTT